MPLLDIWQVRLICKAGNQWSQNVRYYQTTQETGDPPAAADVATAVSANFQAEYILCLAASASYQGVIAQKIVPIPALDSGSHQVSLAGERGVDPVLQVCGLIRLRSGFAGKTGRGRVYIPFPSGTDFDANGDPIAAYKTSLLNLAASFLDTITIGPLGAPTWTGSPILYRRKTGSTRPILTESISQTYATQRRRADTRHGDATPFG